MPELIEQLVAEPTEDERNTLVITYVLYAAGLLGIFFLPIAGVIVNHLKIDQVGATARSHHRWLLRTFWWSLGWGAVLSALHFTIILIPLAWLGYAVLGVWYVYRIVRGGLNLADRQPMPVV